jgi:hypothetical protein
VDEFSALVRSSGFLPLEDRLNSPNMSEVAFHQVLGPLCPSMPSMTEMFRGLPASVAAIMTTAGALERAYEVDASARAISLSIILFFDVTLDLFETNLDEIQIATAGTNSCDSPGLWFPYLLLLAEEHEFGSGVRVESRAFTVRRIPIADHSDDELRVIEGPGWDLRSATKFDDSVFDNFTMEREVSFYDAGHVSVVGVAEDEGFFDLQVLYPLADIDAAIHFQIQSLPYDPSQGELTFDEVVDLLTRLSNFLGDLAQQAGGKLYDWIAEEPVAPG